MNARKLTLGLFVALMVMGMQSCGQSRPENKSGHDLWLGDITVPVEAPYKVLLDQYDKELVMRDSVSKATIRA